MAFFDKLNQVAKNIGDRTTDAIETTKLNGRITSEKTAANEELLKIGRYYYERYLTGQADEAVLEFCQAAKNHLDTADQLQAEIDRIRAENEAQRPAAAPVGCAAAGGVTCPGCGTALPAGTKSCSGCGSKIEAAPAAQSPGIFCPGCGAKLPAGTKFCNGCGQRLDG